MMMFFLLCIQDSENNNPVMVIIDNLITQKISSMCILIHILLIILRENIKKYKFIT